MAYLSNQSEVSNNGLAGFIFFCTRQNFAEQLRRHLLALPIEYLDRVKAIRPGLPLFLYNCSERRLHGVFEAVCNGGSNLTNPPRKHSGSVFDSQYPAQVKMRVREKRTSLDIDQVRSALYPHGHHELQLELSPTQVENLLRLFECQSRKSRGCKNATCNTEGKSRFAVFPKDEIFKISFGSHKATMKTFVCASHACSCSNGALESRPKQQKRNETIWRKKAVSTGAATNNSTDNTEMTVLDMENNHSTSGQEHKISQAEATSLNSSNHDITSEQLNLSGQKFHKHSETSNTKVFSHPHRIFGDQKNVSVQTRNCNHDDKEQIFDQEQKQQNQKGILEQKLPYLPYVLEIPDQYWNVPLVDTLSEVFHSSSYPLEEQNYTPLGTSMFSTTYDVLEASEVNMHSLHYEILQFAHNVRQSDVVYQQVEAAVECVRLQVKHRWPNKDVEVFGSFATGLCLNHSDIDLVVVDRSWQTGIETSPGKEDTLSLIRELAKQLRGCSWCERLDTIESAAIPVIKLSCKPSVVVSTKERSCLTPIDIDITIEGRNGNKNIHSGLNAREFVLQKLLQFPSLVPLVLLLKSYLHHKGLNTVYYGGLSSYSLTLMLVFYLEQMFPSSPDMPPPSVSLKPVESLCLLGKDFSAGEPVIRRAKYVIDQLLRLLDSSVGPPNLGTLLKGFLWFFGSNIEFSRMRIVLQGKDGNSGGIFWQNESQTPAPLYIEDPLRPGVNVGAGSFNMCLVQNAFLEMLQILSSPLPDTLNHTSHESSLPHIDELLCKTRS